MNKIRIPIPKIIHQTPVIVPRDVAEKYVDIVNLSYLIDNMVDGIAQAAVIQSTLPPKERQTCLAHIKATLGASIEIHKEELRQAHIDEVLSLYTPEELMALVEFHDSPVGRRIRQKGPLDVSKQPTSKVFMKIDHLARKLLADYGLADKNET